MDTIKLEVPMDPIALRGIGRGLIEMADGMRPGGKRTPPTQAAPTPPPTQAAPTPPPTQAAPTPPPTQAAPTPPPTQAAPTPPPTSPAQAPPTSPAQAPPTSPAQAAAGVELDGENLPWDARIHTKARTKLVKDNTWKLARGVDPALVEQVKAELRQTMGAAPVAPPPTTVNFQEFIAATTAAGLTPEVVKAACQKFGVDSVPLLPSRPDLIPSIYAELFPQGRV